MAKITRKRMARGLKLTQQHVFDPLHDAGDALSGQVTYDQMADGYGTFRVTWNIPILGGTFLAAAGGPKELMLPVMFPPMQEYFDEVNRHVTTATPEILIEECTVGWDQRDESCAVRDAIDANEGKMNATAAALAAYNLRMRLLRKRPTMLWEDDTNSERLMAQQEVWRAVIDPASSQSDSYRSGNPVVITGINHAVDRYAVYYLAVGDARQSTDMDTYAYVSLTISLKCKTRLTLRDGVFGVSAMPRNAPEGRMQRGAAVVTTTRPVKDTDIEADTVDGVQTNLGIIDTAVHGRLWGGFDEKAWKSPEEHILHDAAYEVIMVPMFGGMPTHITAATVDRLPYVDVLGQGNRDRTCDRRCIPLVHPLVIHHVYAFFSSLAPSATTIAALSANLKHCVGVGLGAGLRGDLVTYQEVAYLEIDPFSAFSVGALAIDLSATLTSPHTGGLTNGIIAFEVPLVYPDTGADGNGYRPQGRPVYAGREVGIENSRSQIPAQLGVALAAPETAGQEQWIEVRWSFGDAIRGLNLGAPPAYDAEDVFAGYGGFWVQLVCKKHLCGGEV